MEKESIKKKLIKNELIKNKPIKKHWLNDDIEKNSIKRNKKID